MNNNTTSNPSMKTDILSLAPSHQKEEELHSHHTGLMPVAGAHEIMATSDGLGWGALHSSILSEQPHQTQHETSPHVWLTIALDKDTLVSRNIRGKCETGLLACGAVSIRPSGMETGVILEGSATVNHVFLGAHIIKDVAATLFPDDPAAVEILPRFGATDPVITNLLAAARSALSTPAGSASLYIDYLARIFAEHLLQHHSNRSGELLQPRRLSLGSRQITNITEHINANIESCVRIDDLARIVGLSSTHFTRSLVKSTGHTPHQYVLHLRVELAKSMLANSSTPIRDIALSCGFSSQAHLTSVFSKRVGTTPSAFRINRR